MIITAFNPSTEDLEKTFLSGFTAAGTTSPISVKNVDRFTADQRVLIGNMGNEHSEIITLNAVDTTAQTLDFTGATLFDHDADDPVYLLEYDQVNFFRKDGIDGSPALLHTEFIDVDNADGLTRWDDTGSLSSHYYQITYSNSITSEESDLSDPMQATGYSRKTIGNVIDRVVRRVRDTGYMVFTTDEYVDIAGEVGDDLITQMERPYGFLRRTVPLDIDITKTSTISSDIMAIALPEDFWKFDHAYLSTMSGNYRRFDEEDPLSLEDFLSRYDNNQSAAQDNVLDIALDSDNKQLLIWPFARTNRTGGVKFTYYKEFDPIIDVGSLIETPNSLIYYYKMMAEYYSAKSETDNQWARLAKKYEDKYGNEIVKMQRTNRRDAGTPRSMKPKRSFRRRRYHL